MKNAFNMAVTGKTVTGLRGPVVYNDDELTCPATGIEHYWFLIVSVHRRGRTHYHFSNGFQKKNLELPSQRAQTAFPSKAEFIFPVEAGDVLSGCRGLVTEEHDSHSGEWLSHSVKPELPTHRHCAASTLWIVKSTGFHILSSVTKTPTCGVWVA